MYAAAVHVMFEKLIFPPLSLLTNARIGSVSCSFEKRKPLGIKYVARVGG
jgi:hypothetical protein